VQDAHALSLQRLKGFAALDRFEKGSEHRVALERFGSIRISPAQVPVFR